MGDSLKIAYLGAGVLENSLRFCSAPPSEALLDEFDAAARQDAAVRAAVQCMWWDESDPHRARFQRFAGPA
jgi:hypothetical protein